MSFQIYQREKSQALDLLERVTDRLIEQANDLRDDDLGRELATDTTTGLFRKIELMSTQLNREVPVDLATLASLLNNFDHLKYGSAVEYFATYFSNYNTDRDEFLLAAGYSLSINDRLCYEDIDEVNWKEAA